MKFKDLKPGDNFILGDKLDNDQIYIYKKLNMPVISADIACIKSIEIMECEKSPADIAKVIIEIFEKTCSAILLKNGKIKMIPDDTEITFLN